MSHRPIRTAMHELRMHEGAVKLLQYAAQDIEENQCQDCTQYDVRDGAFHCPDLQPARTHSGAIECIRMKKGGC